MRHWFETRWAETVLIIVVGTFLAAVSHEYVEYYTRTISKDMDRGLERAERVANSIDEWVWTFLSGGYYLFLGWIALMWDVAVFTFYRYPVLILRWYIRPGMFHRPRCMAFLYAIPLRYDNAAQIDGQCIDDLCGLKEGDSPVVVFVDMSRVHLCIFIVVWTALSKIYTVYPIYRSPIFWIMPVSAFLFLYLITMITFLLGEYEDIHGLGMCMNK
jgi:hypothetical protein